MTSPIQKSGPVRWLLSLISILSTLPGQASGPHHSNPILVPDDPSGFDLSWHGELNTAYFVQFSTDLVHWEYLDFTHRGQGQLVPFWYDCNDSSTTMYLRIRWMNNAPVGDADGDGAPDSYEVGVLGSDPLVHEEDVRFLVDLDGDGIIDLDETTLGLDPTTADTPGSDEVAQAGPLLLTQVYESTYLFSEILQSQNALVPGTRTQQLWGQPTVGGTIQQPLSLENFRLENTSFGFPLDQEGLARQFSFTDRLKNRKHSISLGMTYARVDTEPDGQAVNRWSTKQSAHMIKLPFPAEEEEHFPFLEIPTYTRQTTLVPYQITQGDHETDRAYEVRLFGITESGVEEAGVTLRTMTVPAGQRSSNVLKVRPDVELVPEGSYWTTLRRLIPVLKAPEVLAVNSDFDEGRIDTATGYAIPDCDDIPGVDRKTGSGNTEIRLDTERDHLDGLYLNDERVTDDLHPAWFGIHPKAMPDHFWDGAEVTIRKLVRDDPDTGRPGSGQVRFYAKWGDEKFGNYYGIETYDFEGIEPPVNLVTGGINKRDGESVYGSASEIPDNVQFWMEGVRPGKITLEWRLKKGSIDVAYEQTFLVETQQSEYEWKADLLYLIRLQTHDDSSGTDYGPSLDGFGGEVNINTYIKSSGNFSYPERAEVLSEYYDFYRQCWDIDKALDWAGVARAGVSGVVAGVSDMQYAINDFSLIVNLVEAGSGVSGIGVSDIQDFQDGLFSGAFDIFHSLAWQHYAFLASGYGALKYVDELRIADPDPEVEMMVKGSMEGWRLLGEASDLLLDGADLASVKSLLVKGGRKIAKYEQLVVADPAFSKMALAGGSKFIGLISSDLAKPPLLGCALFNTFHQGKGNLGLKEHRWQWIDGGFSDSFVPYYALNVNGPLKTWSLFAKGAREGSVHSLLEDKAQSYSNLNTLLYPVRVHDGLEAPLKQ